MSTNTHDVSRAGPGLLYTLPYGSDSYTLLTGFSADL